MLRAKIVVLSLLCSIAPALAQSGDSVIVRTSLEPESGVVLGQRARLLVDVLFAGSMPRPPRVTMPDIAGAQILRYETQGTTMSDTIDGRSYVGQRFEFALYPRRGSRLEVPAAEVTLLDRRGDTTGHVQGQPLALDVAVPPGIDPSRPVIATSRLTLDEQWTPAPTTAFKSGDALVRTITRNAADVPAMAMLDLAFPAPPGVRVYLDAPQTDDRQDRGDVTGHRVDKVTYVFGQAGSFTLPGVVQSWWDLESSRLRNARTPDVTVVVAAVAASSSRADRVESWIFAASTVAGLLAFVGWAWPRLLNRLAHRRALWLASEPKAYADLNAACRGGDARATYRAFVIWKQRAPQHVPAALAEELERVLFAGEPWSPERGRAFATKVKMARQAARSRPVTALPPLNPAR